MQFIYLNNQFTRFIISHITRTYIFKLFYFLIFLILFSELAINLHLWSQIHIWRHDSAYYFNDYWGLLIGEGRWLNYLVFDIVRRIPPHLTIFFCFCCFFYFFFVCAKPFTGWKCAIVFALASLQLSPIYDLLGWPAIALSDFVVLGACTYLKNRVAWPYLFLLAAILFHGCINSFYNLLPLLFLFELYEGKISLLKLILAYVVCFIIGFFVMEGIVLLIAGQPMQIGRAHKYVTNFTSFVDNLKIEIFWLKDCLEHIGHKTIFFACVVPFIGVVYTFFKSKECKKNILLSYCSCWILSSCSMLAPFVQAFPFGLPVGLRTTVSTYGALLGWLLVFFPRFKAVSILVLLLISTPMFNSNAESLFFYNIVSSQYYNNLIKIDIVQGLYNVFFTSTNEDMQKTQDTLMKIHHLQNPVIEHLATSLRWRPSAWEAGFGTVINKWAEDGNLNPDIPKWLLEKEYSCQYSHNGFYRWCINGDWLIIGLEWPPVFSK